MNTIIALIEREMLTLFGGSFASLLWTLAEPVAAILVLSALFYVIVPSPPLGDSFLLFYASGVVPLVGLQAVLQKAAVASRANRTLFGFGRIGLFEVAFSQIVVVALFQFFAGVVVIMLACFWTGWRMVGGFAPVLFSMAVFGSGAAMLSFWLGAYFQLWPRILAMLLRPLVLVSGVFFLIDDIGSPYADWLLWNPFAHVIMAFRSSIYGFYPSFDAELAWPILVGFGCAFTAVTGLRVTETQLLDRTVT